MEMAEFDDSVSIAAGMDTKGGAMTTSASSVMLSSLAENVLRKSTASRGPMFIFQFAAMIGLRMILNGEL